MNWYIGQEIVCINAKGVGELKNGKIYTIQSLSKNCKCNQVNIDVGISDGKGTCCYICRTDVSNNTRWFMESRFTPLEYNQDAINELLEQTKVENAKL